VGFVCIALPWKVTRGPYPTLSYVLGRLIRPALEKNYLLKTLPYDKTLKGGFL
jgi:hypothetical protein